MFSAMDKSPSTSKAHVQEEKRRPDPMHGFMFQLKLLMLFLYRGVSRGHSFLLGTEIEEANKFDDLVFEFTQNEKKYYRLLQAKHKADKTKCLISDESLFKDTKSNYHLPKYFFSHLDAKKNNLFADGIIKDVIICTNINFSDEVIRSRKIKSIENQDDILGIKIGCHTKPILYKFTEKIVPILEPHLNSYKIKMKLRNSNYSNDDIKDFISTLIFAVDCPSEEELGEIIRGEIGKEFDLQNADNVYNKFFVIMQEWLQGKQMGRFISDKEGKQFFEDARNGIPVLFNIKSPVASFTGRSKELDILHELLTKPTNDKPQVVCITGIGGVGKSELARKYISEYRMEYSNNVLWVNAESNRTLESCFRSLASDKLGITTKNANGYEKGITSIIEEVYRAFSNRRCLMIFDNAQHYRTQEEFDGGIDRFLPQCSYDTRPCILMTSRNQKWPSAIRVVPLDMFEKEEALQFISKVLETNINECAALAGEMQYYPLALQQAVSYIKVRNMTLQNIGSHFDIPRYLNVFKQKRKEILNFPFPEDSDTDYTKTVYITWNATLDLIKNSEDGHVALKIMNILAYMGPEDIPVELFHDFVDGNDESLSSALEILRQYSMISIHRKAISVEEHEVVYNCVVNVHSLVQDVIRLKLEEENQNKSVLEKALTIFANRQNINNKTLTHAISVWDYSSQPGILSGEKIILASLVSTNISLELLSNYQYSELNSFGQKAIVFSSSFPIDYGDDVVMSCGSIVIMNVYLSILRPCLAFALEALGKYEDAIESFQDALSFRESLFGKDDPDTLIIKGSLAENLLKKGNYNEAIKLLTKLGEDHPQFYLGKLTLAKALKVHGKDDEALDILKELEKNLRQQDSTESKEVLADVLHLEGKFEGALHLYQTLDYSKEGTRIKTHNNFNIKYKIAQIYLEQKKYPEALKVLKEVVDIGRKLYGENHPHTLSSQFKTAEILRQQNKFDESSKLFEETYEKQKVVLGENHLSTLNSLLGMATTLDYQGKLNDSLIRIYREVLNKRITQLEKEHPSSLEMFICIGDMLHKMKKYDEALEMYNEVHNIKKKPKNNTDNLDLMIKLGKVHFDKREFNQALPIFEDAKKLIKDNYGSDHSDYLSVSTKIAQIHTLQGKNDLALSHLQEVLEVRKKKLGEDHPDCLFTNYQIATILYFKNEYNESLKMLRELLAKTDAILEKDHSLPLLIRNIIAVILASQNKSDEALQECKAVKEILNLNPAGNQGIKINNRKILVNIFSKQKRHEEVLNLLGEILEILKSDPNKNTLAITETENQIAMTLSILGKPQRD